MELGYPPSPPATIVRGGWEYRTCVLRPTLDLVTILCPISPSPVEAAESDGGQGQGSLWLGLGGRGAAKGLRGCRIAGCRHDRHHSPRRRQHRQHRQHHQ